LAEYLATSAGVAHDLALVFHPGFQKHLGWLRDGSLARLIAAGTRVVAASYEYDEAQIDRRVAACHGFSSAGDALVNPFFLELGDARSQIRWGNVLWQLGSPPGERGIDEAGLAKLEQLSAMVMHSIARQLAPTAAYGTEALFSATDGTRRSLIYVFDDYFLDFDTRRLLAFRKGSLDEIGSVSAADVRAYPGPATGDLDRALWAADIKARYLLDAYPEPLDDHAQQRLARSMYAELGARVDAIFKADDP
jgi:hypothetical protein